MIFSGHAPDGIMYTDQGKQPDRAKNKNYQKQELPYKIIRKKIRKKEQERKETDDEPFNRQEVYIL
jgi:hypothetical protein